MITAGHRTISGQFRQMSVQLFYERTLCQIRPRRRACACAPDAHTHTTPHRVRPAFATALCKVGMAESTSVISEPPPAKRRKVTVSTVNKWKIENDKALNTSMWLTFEKLGRDHVALLKCTVCGRFEEKLRGCRNYNPAFVVGTTNLRVSAVKDHADTDMHKRSMLLLSKSRSKNAVEYVPIAKALSTLDPDTASKMKRKFEIAYMLCKEGLAFTKMEAVCELEEKHGVNLGTGYKNNQACATFVDYIAQSQREGLAAVLAKAKFLSIQADGSTDSEDELFLVLYFDAHSQDGVVHVQNRFLTVRRPMPVDSTSVLLEPFSMQVSLIGRIS